MKLEIDFGKTSRKMPGFVRVGNSRETRPDYLIDLSRDRLPLKDNSVEEVYSYHTLEYVEDLLHLLRELYRVSKGGAVWNIFTHHWSSIIGKAPGHRNYFDEEFFQGFGEKLEKHGEKAGIDLRVDNVRVIRGKFRFWKKYMVHFRLRVVK